MYSMYLNLYLYLMHAMCVMTDMQATCKPCACHVRAMCMPRACHVYAMCASWLTCEPYKVLTHSSLFHSFTPHFPTNCSWCVGMGEVRNHQQAAAEGGHGCGGRAPGQDATHHRE